MRLIFETPKSSKPEHIYLSVAYLLKGRFSETLKLLSMEIVLSVIGTIVAIIGLKLQFFSKPKEELEHLKTQFRTTQTLSQHVQQQLKAVMIKNNWQDKYLFGEIKYSTYLEQMKSTSKSNLSDELYNRILKENLPKSLLISVTSSLEKQFEALQQIQGLITAQDLQS